mmetsp:Transcript_111069/g.265126  ORF Transcript_111069/g.265126 Transcript_111069/m.265126 type:complete len:216 (+) Transcript_111069:451-1098(+)
MKKLTALHWFPSRRSAQTTPNMWKWKMKMTTLKRMPTNRLLYKGESLRCMTTVFICPTGVLGVPQTDTPRSTSARGSRRLCIGSIFSNHFSTSFTGCSTTASGEFKSSSCVGSRSSLTRSAWVGKEKLLSRLLATCCVCGRRRQQLQQVSAPCTRCAPIKCANSGSSCTVSVRGKSIRLANLVLFTVSNLTILVWRCCLRVSSRKKALPDREISF